MGHGACALENLAMTATAFWRGKRVLLTGHTGFKGAWTALWLMRAGAQVTGFALSPPEDRASLFACAAPWPHLHSMIGDLRDSAAVRGAVETADPEIVIHMAAQALVRRSYREPVETFGTNVMGTVNLLAALANRTALRTILVVTSDKVYANDGTGRAFREDDPLGGDDPYSASKAAAELVVRSWRKSFLTAPGSPVLAVARGGNVIGGGDWGEDRLIPDIIRAGVKGEPVQLRYPDATRPWQHVLDVVSGYLAYVEHLTERPHETPVALNFGPLRNARTMCVRDIVEQLQGEFGWDHGWAAESAAPLPEKIVLTLDPSAAAKTLSWGPKLGISAALAWIARWHRAHLAGSNMQDISLADIGAYESLSAAGKSRQAVE
jgi:CDP-glucose 4,6-dehydratase